MDEGDPMATRPGPGFLIDQGIALGSAGGQGSVEIGNPVADVMNPRAAAGQESTDRRIGAGGLEQLDLSASEVEMNNPGAVDLFGAARLHPEHVAVKAQRGVDAFDGDAEMGNGGIHDGNI